MIGHKSSGIARRLRLLKQIPKPIDEVISVGVILDNRPALDSTNDNVLQCSRCINSGLARNDE
jgi:hypothetical protein